LLLILTYQLQTVLGYSAFRTGLALLPLAIGGVLSAAVIAPRLGQRIAPRWLIAAGLTLSAGGLAPLIFVTPASSAHRSARPCSTPSPPLRPPPTLSPTRARWP
jgi:hypothetical protein